HVAFGGTSFAAVSASLGVADSSVLAVQPVKAIEAQSAGYRRFVILVALLTLSLAGLLAMRLARPVARVLVDVARLSRQAGADAARTAERIRRAVTAVEVEGPTGELARVTASFGIAEFPTYANADALVAAADAALYQAKRGGKDQVATATLQGQDVVSNDVPA